MIEVILLERVEKLGSMGKKVKVRPGYARNYLLPQKKALRATKENLALFEQQRAELEAKNAAKRAEAEKQAEKMTDLKVVVIRQSSEMGMLYGSVTARDVAEAIKETKHAVDRLMIQIDTPIKTLGLFPVKVRLHPEVTVMVTVNVARSPEEAQVQAEKGAAVIKAEAAEAEAAAEVAMVENIGKVEEPTEEKKEKKAKKSKKDSEAE